MNTSHDFTSSTSITDGEPYEIDGLNIWDHEWKNTGERAIIADTSGRKVSVFVYEISADGKIVPFAVNEVSNGVFIVYHNYYGN